MNTQDKIDRYLDNLLDPDDKKSFERELLLNVQLSDEVERRKEILSSLESNLKYKSMFTDSEDREKISTTEEYAMEEDIIEFHKEYEVKDPGKESDLKKKIDQLINPGDNEVKEPMPLYKLAASLFIFVLISASLLFYLYNTNHQKSINTARVASGFLPSEKDEYLKGIKHSMILMRNSLDTENLDPEEKESITKTLNQNILLLDAISDLENNERSFARKKFDKIITEINPRSKPALDWYKAILTAIEGDHKESVKIFKQISRENNYYSPSADSLLRIIKPE